MISFIILIVVKMERLIFDKNTTHFVVNFDEKSKNGKTTIDLVPVAWVFQTENKLYINVCGIERFDLGKICGVKV